MVVDRLDGGVARKRFCDSWRDQTERRIQALVAEHVVLRALCDRLEAIADGLPRLPPHGERQQLARHLTTLITPHQAREDDLLESLLPPEGASAVERSLVERIRGQHIMDAVHAQDLGAALEAAGPGEDPEALGYMLRCFFDGCRRAMAFEELTLLNLCGRRLSPGTDALLSACLRTGPALN
ncbi:Hemerythrin HHE cation binding domain-containing protein [Roseomonas rosea]|uniref:Hemerythrin HHE cation binding domain-containing protein n=1 Tax=Muricoccus roseus TaxID=198092 RepID=A0A1M6I6L2_9PROT|nr:hemerythrin domain-containing protein [Roseomonas rosea]SHJ30088.1 Hemerythrin HHE cation binding domain-containing protein [Roseomonas rosea]